MKEFILPKYWYIRVSDENAKIVNKWKQQVNPNSYNAKDCTYIDSRGDGGGVGRGQGEITFEQFKKYILKQDDMSEIVGYKCPLMLFNGNIPKGTIYRPLASKKNTTYAATCYNGRIIDSGKTNLPKEIVEQWEPVYAPKYTLPKIYGYEGKTNHPGGSLEHSTVVEYGCAVINVMMLKNLLKASNHSTTHGAGNRSIKSIKLSSDVEITIEEIKQIVEYFDNL